MKAPFRLNVSTNPCPNVVTLLFYSVFLICKINTQFSLTLFPSAVKKKPKM